MSGREHAGERLAAIFDERAMPPDLARSALMLGVFGNGLPEALVTVDGIAVVDVKSAPESALGLRQPQIADLIEPFIDDYARIFLHRLFSGHFDHLAAIVFCRDDQAALTAYQYALEIRRQGLASAAPKLLLWNFVHRESAPVRRFNRGEADRLRLSLGLKPAAGIDPARFAQRLEDERRRRAVLARLEALQAKAVVSGGTAMVWRNAGRYLPAGTFADLLEAALSAPAASSGKTPRRRFTLVGAALDDPGFHAAVERAGAIVCDIQPFGAAWPPPVPEEATVEGLLASHAADRSDARFFPVRDHLDWVVATARKARPDCVLFQLDQHDDTIGWDIPALKRAFAAEGIVTIDLGFRDHRASAEALQALSERLAEGGEARP